MKAAFAIFLLMFGSQIRAPEIAMPKIYTAEEVEEIELPIELFNVSDGLSQGYVGTLAQDKLGYLWITTRDGLNLFDGYE